MTVMLQATDYEFNASPLLHSCVLGKTLYGDFSCLIALLATKMSCADSAGNSEADAKAICSV